MMDFRPNEISHLFGQEHLWTVLTQWKQNLDLIPHTIGIFGPYGCGKTSVARMLAGWLTDTPANITEINASEARGIDEVRDLAEASRFNPLGRGSRVYIIDEIQGMTPQAQGALLKVLEDGPKHTYFILCSTDPQKILNTIRSRCTPLEVKLLSRQSTDHYTNWLSQWWYQREFSPQVQEAIYMRSGGHARDIVMLVRLLGQGGNFDKPDGLPVEWGPAQSIEAFKAVVAGRGEYLPGILASVEPNIYALDNFIDQSAVDINSAIFKNYYKLLSLRSNRKLYLIDAREYILGTLSLVMNEKN